MNVQTAIDAKIPTVSPLRGALLFVVAMFGQAAQSVIFAVPSPVLPAMAHSFGAAEGTLVAQMLYALPSLGVVIFGFFSGWLLDRFGLRRTLLTALAAYGIMGSVPVFTASLPLLFVTRLCLGMACALVTTGCVMLLVISYQGEKRSRFMGFQSAFGSVTGLVCIVVAGALGHAFGWHAAFATYGGAAFIVLVFAAYVVHGRRVEESAETELQIGHAEGGILAVMKKLWPVYLAGCLLFTYPMAAGSALPFVLAQRGVGPGLLDSLLLSAFTIFSATGAFTYGFVRRGLSARLTFALGMLLTAIGMIVTGLVTSPLATFAGIGLAGLGLGYYIPHLWIVTATAVPEHLRGRAAGLFNSAMYLGGFTSPFILNALTHSFGTAGTFTVTGLIALAAAFALVVSKPMLLTGNVTAPPGSAPVLGH